MPERTRRGMFGELFAGLARAAEERLPDGLVGERQALPKPSSRRPAPPIPAGPPEPEPVPPTRSIVSEEGFGELIAEAGLGALEEGIRELAVRGARLHPEPGAEEEILDPAAMPAELAVDLNGPAGATALPSTGCLRVALRTASAAPPEPGPIEVELELAAELGPEVALMPSPELTLPRAWSAPAQALELAPGQVEPWEELRALLAEAQGVKLTDEGPRSFAVHRLLGYPDERSGQMPLWSELLERGADLGDDPPSIHPQAAELASRAARWRLLLQISREPRLGWRWGERTERLYVWLPQEDLEAHDLTHPRAFLR